MSLADFSQYAQDHACLFVYVTALGETSGALYGAVLDFLQNFPPVPSGKDSFIFLRLLNRLPRWARDGQSWREFQPYKQVFGVLAVTQCHEKDDLDAVEDAFLAACSPYRATVLEKQCIVYGSKSELGKGVQSKEKFNVVDFDNSQSFTQPDMKIDEARLREIVTRFAESLYGKLHEHIRDLTNELESGRPRLLRSPVDGKETENEEDTRLSKTKLVGRMYKHIADLYLLCGELQFACNCFGQAISQLSRDNLWAGSANEGLGAMYIMKDRHDVLSGQKSAPLSIQSNLIGFWKVSAKITGPKLSLKELSRRKGSNVVSDGGGGGGGGGEDKGNMSNGRPSLYKRPKSPVGDGHADSLDSIEDESMEAGDLDASEESTIEGEGEDEDPTRKLLQKDLVVDRFTRAEVNYKKAGSAGGVPRMELLFKFARYLVLQERNKAATEVLQRVFWTHSFINEEDKTTLYETMAEVFTSMGYHRKASLFLHWASLHACKIATSLQDCYKAHSLLSQSLPGYKLNTTGNAVTQATTSALSGWPLLQAILMKDLVYLTLKTEQNGMYIQLSCMLLQNLHLYLNDDDLEYVIKHLDNVTKTQTQMSATNSSSSSPNHSPNTFQQRRLSRYLSTDSLVSPLPLTEFPMVCTFRPKQFPAQLRPYKTPGNPLGSSDSPFIVSQLHGKKRQRQEILWVIHDPAEIAMDVTNPLDFELRVENMKLLSKGASISACPSSLSLPAHDKQDFTLTALPREAGQLELIGYEHTVFGVHSKCKVKVVGNPLIRIIPALPQLRLNILPTFHAPMSRNGTETASINSSPFKRGEAQRSSIGPRIEIDMIDGESCCVEFKLECQKVTPVESLSLSLECSANTENHTPNEFFDIVCPTQEDIKKLLPIANKEKRTFSVKIAAKFPSYYRVKNDFVSSLSKQQPCTEHGSTPTSYVTEKMDLPQKLPLKRKGSPFKSSASKQYSPSNTSPVTKRPIDKMDLIKHPHQLHMLDPVLSPIMDRLNIDVPLGSKVATSTLPRVHRKGSPPVATKRESFGLSRTASTKSPKKYHDEWDFNQFMDKRASIRSDPGERKREGGGILNRSPRSSGMSTPLQKSPSLASRTGSLLDESESPTKTSRDGGGAVFTYDRTGSPRLSSGGSSSSPVRLPTRRGPQAIKKNVISLPSDLRHHALTILPTEVPVVGTFTLKYSGGEGGNAGYHRRMESSIKVKVCPSLYFDEFNIASVVGRQNLFSLSFYIHNKSGHILNIICSCKTGEEGKSPQYVVRLRSKQKEKMEMILLRFNLPESPALLTMDKPKAAQLYSNHLAKMVSVEWELEGSGRRGVGNLEGMRLPSSLLHLIQPVPLLIDVMVNDKWFAMDSESSEEYCIGTPVNMCLTVTNNAGCTMCCSWILVELCEFFGQSSSHNVTDTGRIVYSGNLLQRIPQLKAGETYKHRVSLVFFYKGTYQIEVRAYVPAPRDGSQDETDLDGGAVLQPYSDNRVCSPILRGSRSPPHVREPLSELCGSGGSIFTPVKIHPHPLKTQLVPTRTTQDVHTSSQERLMSIAEVTRMAVGGEEDKTASPQPRLLEEQLSFPLQQPTRCRADSTAVNVDSMHKRLSWSCERPVAGPVLLLHIVESCASQQTHS